MMIDGAGSQTAVEAWDKRWATSEGLADWLEPHPAAVTILPQLHARGAKAGARSRLWLRPACAVAREHGVDVERIEIRKIRGPLNHRFSSIRRDRRGGSRTEISVRPSRGIPR
jgi:hypothetical protein